MNKSEAILSGNQCVIVLYQGPFMVQGLLSSTWQGKLSKYQEV